MCCLDSYNASNIIKHFGTLNMIVLILKGYRIKLEFFFFKFAIFEWKSLYWIKFWIFKEQIMSKVTLCTVCSINMSVDTLILRFTLIPSIYSQLNSLKRLNGQQISHQIYKKKFDMVCLVMNYYLVKKISIYFTF